MTQRNNNLAVPDFPPQSPQSQAGASLPPIQDQLDQLTQLVHQLIQNHHHNGADASSIQLSTEVRGLFETVSAVPSGTPQNLFDQFKVYENSGTHRLYWYDAVAHAWRYAAGT